MKSVDTDRAISKQSANANEKSPSANRPWKRVHFKFLCRRGTNERKLSMNYTKNLSRFKFSESEKSSTRVDGLSLEI